jgi:hypothetical protein
MSSARALLLSAAAASMASAQGGVSNQGCTCVSACGYSPATLAPWCQTSTSPPAANATCGFFSSPDDYFWDYCTQNTTSSAQSAALLRDFSSMWTAVAVPAVAVATVAAAAAGCAAVAHAAPPRAALLWALPAAAALIGGCHALFVAAAVAAILAFFYLSMPYALELSVAVALGVALGLLLVYASLGRQHAEKHTRHPSEFSET